MRNRETERNHWIFGAHFPRVAPRRPASPRIPGPQVPAPCEAAQRAVPRTVGHNLDAGIGRIANVEICCRYTL